MQQNLFQKIKRTLGFVLSAVALFYLIGCNGADSSSKEGKDSSEWELVWQDEFDEGEAPDARKWNYEEGYIRNHEEQYYTVDRRENTRIEDGKLILEARKDSVDLEGKIRPITSASINTKDKASWKEGKIEVKAKLPEGRGTWPAIWMLGQDIDSVGWPLCGEIDIMEHVGYDPGKIHTTLHSQAFNWMKENDITADTLITDFSEKFHTYAVERDAQEIKFFLDGKLLLSFKNTFETKEEWPFNSPFYLTLNLAIGGDWGGKEGVDLESLPARMTVDYVRVYQKKKEE